MGLRTRRRGLKRALQALTPQCLPAQQLSLARTLPCFSISPPCSCATARDRRKAEEDKRRRQQEAEAELLAEGDGEGEDAAVAAAAAAVRAARREPSPLQALGAALAPQVGGLIWAGQFFLAQGIEIERDTKNTWFCSLGHPALPAVLPRC